MPSAAPSPALRRASTSPQPSRGGRIGAIAGAAFLLTVGIENYWFPRAWQQLLRDWVMHFTGVIAVTLATAMVLGLNGEPNELLRRRRLAVGVPFLCLALHELGQWIWPTGPRDAFDSVRDVLLNLAGTLVAARLLRP